MIPKFRAWDKARNEMNYKVMVGNCDIDDENWTCPIVWIEEKKDWLHFDDYECIMQSTDLRDRNSVEIFEGDILRVTNEHSWLEVVSYSKERAMFVTEEINREFKVPESPLYDLFNTNIFKFEVIGNIYENPEILEDKKWN